MPVQDTICVANPKVAYFGSKHDIFDSDEDTIIAFMMSEYRKTDSQFKFLFDLFSPADFIGYNYYELQRKLIFKTTYEKYTQKMQYWKKCIKDRLSSNNKLKGAINFIDFDYIYDNFIYRRYFANEFSIINLTMQINAASSCDENCIADSEDSFKIIASKNIMQGDEILHNYTNLCYTEELVTYGMHIENKPEETLRVSFELFNQNYMADKNDMVSLYLHPKKEHFKPIYELYKSRLCTYNSRNNFEKNSLEYLKLRILDGFLLSDPSIENLSSSDLNNYLTQTILKAVSTEKRILKKNLLFIDEMLNSEHK